MNREQKSNYVSSLKESLNNNEAMMIYHYHGLNVNQLDDLRNQMREAGALKDTQHEEAISLFSGQTGVALSKDPITLAKTLVNFQKKNDMLKIVGGVMDSKVLAPEDVAKIATLPTLDEARAKIAAILQTPAQQLISILLAPGAKIANLAHAKSLKKD